MPRVRIDRTERYPVYDLDDKLGRGEVEVDDDTLARWQRVSAEYEQMQGEMHDLLAANPAYWDGNYWHI